MWAAAPGPTVLRRRVLGKLCRSTEVSNEARFGGSSCPNTHHVFVQERLLESGLMRCGYSTAARLVVQKLESLILAQNERWRHA